MTGGITKALIYTAHTINLLYYLVALIWVLKNFILIGPDLRFLSETVILFV
jgi:hypothetical protein